MIEINPDKLRNPLQAGLVAGLIHVLFYWVRDRLQTARAADTPAPTLAERLRPAVIAGAICAIVMHLSNGPQRRTLAEPFERTMVGPPNSSFGTVPVTAPGGLAPM